MPLIRGLTLQLAARYDRSVSEFPGVFYFIRPGQADFPKVSRRSALTYTAGARTFPLPSLMLRASLATGELPPTIASLQSSYDSFEGVRAELADPRRGGRPVGSEGELTYLYGGSARAKPERARTISIGAVLNPSGRTGPRISIDYSAVSVTRAPYLFIWGAPDEEAALAQVPAVLADEESSPDRVLREPLSEADRALGFTGGIVTEIDARGFSQGKSRLDVVEMQVDWTLRSGRAGDFRIYGTATWQPTFKRRSSQNRPWLQLAGLADGPLKWRGNAGVDWTTGPLSLGVNAQYFGSYSALRSIPTPGLNEQIALYQGGKPIDRQLYFDLSARRKFYVGPVLRAAEA